MSYGMVYILVSINKEAHTGAKSGFNVQRERRVITISPSDLLISSYPLHKNSLRYCSELCFIKDTIALEYLVYGYTTNKQKSPED